MLSAEMRAEGVRGWPPLPLDMAPPRLDGLFFELLGGVSRTLPQSLFVSQSAASLLESAAPLAREDCLFNGLLLLLLTLSLSGRSMEAEESRLLTLVDVVAVPVPTTEEEEESLGLGLSTRSSDFRSLVSSFILWTAAWRDSFSSSSDSRKALRSMATLRRLSKSSNEAIVLLKKQQ